MGEIRGTKWKDLNGDGVFDSSESGLAGVTIYLDLNDNKVLDAGEPSTVTLDDDPTTLDVNETGQYAFTGLSASNYIVREVIPTDFVQTFPTGGNSVTGDGFADVVLEYFDSGAGPIAGPYGAIGSSFPVPVDLDVVLGNNPDSLSLPTGSFVTVGFTDEVVVDGPGDDIFIREDGAASELADVFISSNLVDFTLLGNADGGATTSFDLADIGFTQPVRAVKIVGVDNRGGSPGFDVGRVEGLPQSLGEATGANVVILAEDQVIEGLNFGNFELAPDNGGNSFNDFRDLGLLIGTRQVRDSIGGIDLYDFFRFEQVKNSTFDLTLSGLNADAEIALLNGSGVPIKKVSAGDGIDGLIDDELDPGNYYIRVLRFDADSTPYTLEVTGTPIPQPFQIRSVSPQSGSSAGATTITIEGNQFTSGAEVALIDNEGNELTATNVTWLNSETVSATFDLTGLSIEAYDVRVTDAPGTATAEDVFDVNDGSVGQLEVYVSSPSRIRSFGTDVVTVTYRNDGDTDITAPLLRLEAEGASFRLPGEEEFTDNEIQFLGINDQGLAGVLPPGANGSLSIEFKPTAGVGEQIDFAVNAVKPDEIVNWEDFRENLRPNNLTAEAWNAIYDNFIAFAGNTAGDYQAILVDNANYLSQQGEYVSDANRLVGFEFQQASDYQALAQRYNLGSFGRGRFFIGDIRVIADEEGNVTIENLGTQRLFTLQEDGSYLPATGDFGTLTLDGEVYRLEEQNGTITVFRADGNLDFIEDTNGNRITAEYTEDELTGLTASNGDSLTFTRNENNRITSVTDSTGRTTTYSYDATGELLLNVTSPEGTSSYTYDNNFAITSITDGNGTQASFEYDDRGRLIKESFNEGAEEITYSYGDNGEVTVTDASGATTQLSLNDNGQVNQLQDALGRALRISYDEAGNPTKITAPDNSILGFTYDSEGNLLSQVNSLGQRTEFTYEPNFDLLQSVTDPRGNAIAYNYDESGNLLSITYADASSETFSYDTEGNVIESVNRRGQGIYYTYDTRGQLLRQENADSSVLEYTYDDRGNLTSATDSNGTTTLEYDDGDRLTKITYANGHSLAYTYDASGRRTSMTDRSGNTVNYAYDSTGRLAGLSDGDGNSIIAYTYDEVGRLTREDNGNGTYSTYTYDAAGQLTSIVNFAPDNSINSRYDYTYDELGQQAGVITLDGEWTYDYDAIGQLTGAVFTSTNPDISDQNLTYVYDAAGNRIRTVVNGETTEYTTDNLNQYESVGDVVYDYDADGNLISKIEGDNIWTYQYNNENRLVKVIEPNGVETDYEYDGLGNRIATVYDGERTEYLVDPLGLKDVVGEYDDAGNLVANYTHGIGLVSRNDGNESAYFDSNAIGSTVGLTNAAGNQVNSYSYLPFGEELSETETIANPFEFVGQWGVTEEMNGLNFMRQRFYDGDTGRFTSVDPIGLQGGDTNLYTYVINKPTSLVDPQGTVPPLLILIGAGAIIGGGINGAIYTLTSLANSDFNWRGLAGSTISGGLFGGAAAATGGLSTSIGVPTMIGVGGLTSGLGYGIENYGTDQFSKTEFWTSVGVGAATGWIPYKILGYNGKGATGWGKVSSTLLGTLLNRGAKGQPLATSRGLYKSLSTGFSASLLLGKTVDFFGIGDKIADAFTNIVNSFDPNDIIGPAGFGEEGWITSPQLLPYTIRFENEAERATAPAVLVTINHQLDSDLDLTTFELGDFGFGDIVVDVPDGFQNYSERLDLRDTIGSFVDFEAGINPETATATWTLTTIDPETGELATGVDDGFLPPNNENGDGEGFVRYTIEPQTDLTTGTRIDAEAEIIFDFNEPIITPLIFNTIDIGDPTSTVEALPETTTNTNFTVSWSGTDDGSGIADYDVYVSVDGSEFTLWQDDITETSAIYTGEVNKTYSFYSVATDNVGHIEEVPTGADASTTVNEVDNEAPTVDDATFTVDENSTSGIEVGIITATDPENETLTFAITSGNLDPDNDNNLAFVIDPSTGTITVNDKDDLDFEATPTFNLEVTATDAGDLSDTANITVNLNDVPPAQFDTVQSQNGFFTLNGGDPTNIKFTLANNNTENVNEVGVFVVDDENGNVDGNAPGFDGYLKAALQRSQVIFSAISDRPSGFDLGDIERILEVDSDARLGFYLISNGTTDTALAELEAKVTTDLPVFFSDSSNIQVSDLVAESFNLNWSDEVGSSDFTNLDLTVQLTQDAPASATELQGQPQNELIDLRNETGQVLVSVEVHREAAFDNLIGFYQVVDSNGGIDTNGDGVVDFNPGDAGYEEAALTNRITGLDLLQTDNQQTTTFDGTFEGGNILASFMVVDGTVDEAINNNAEVYFSFLGANSDGVDHIRLLGDNTFGYEDLAGGGDFDYNDMIVKFDLTTV